MVYQTSYHIQIVADFFIQHFRLEGGVLKTLRHQSFDSEIQHLSEFFAVYSCRKRGEIHLPVNGIIGVRQNIPLCLDGKQRLAYILGHGTVQKLLHVGIAAHGVHVCGFYLF